MLLLVTVRLVAVAGAPDRCRDGCNRRRRGRRTRRIRPAKIPYVVFSEPTVRRRCGHVPAGRAAVKNQILNRIVIGSCRIRNVKCDTNHDAYVVVLTAVFVIVKFLFVPAVFGLSPSIVTLSAPFSSITPRPDAVADEIVRPSFDGRTNTDVYNAAPAPLLFKTAGAVSVVLAIIATVIAP